MPTEVLTSGTMRELFGVEEGGVDISSCCARSMPATPDGGQLRDHPESHARKKHREQAAGWDIDIFCIVLARILNCLLHGSRKYWDHAGKGTVRRAVYDSRGGS